MSTSKKNGKKRLVASPNVYLEDYIRIYTGFVYKTWSLYYVKLMSTALVCRKNKNDLRPSLIIYLARTSVWDAKSESNKPFSHPERENFIFAVDREDQMKVWINSIREVKENIKLFDDSDIEEYTSSDEDGQSSRGIWCLPSFKSFTKLFRKHRYQHIVENADFMDREKNIQPKLALIQSDSKNIQITFSVPLEKKLEVEKLCQLIETDYELKFVKDRDSEIVDQ